MLVLVELAISLVEVVGYSAIGAVMVVTIGLIAAIAVVAIRDRRG